MEKQTKKQTTKKQISTKKQTVKKQTSTKKQTTKKQAITKSKIDTNNKVIKEANNNLVVENKVTKKHNGVISFWKFMFCLMIVVFHGKLFAKNMEGTVLIGGSIGTEFFFIVSGYLMTKSALKKKSDSDESLGKETFKYMWRKYKNFIPYTLVTGIIGLIIFNMYVDISPIKNISSIFEILLIRMNGIRCLCVNIPTWYISSMLLCMLILYPLIRKYKESYIYIIAPLIVLFGVGYMIQNYGHLRGPGTWMGLTFKGNLRALSELALGSIVYILAEKIKNINFTKLGKIIITLAEIGSFILIFVISHFMQLTFDHDGILLIIITIGITLAFSEKTLEYNLLCNKFSYWLERVSLTLYMIHWPVRMFFISFEPTKNLRYSLKLLTYTATSLILGIILMYIMDFLKKRDYFIPKIKKLIVKEKIEA